jgi:AraC-like DNA-binding protein
MVIRMKSFRSYPIESTEDLPVVVGRSRGIHPGSIILHNHPGIEINLIVEGHTQYIIGGKNYRCGPGDIVLIGEGEVHRAWDADDAVFLVIIFRAELLVPPQMGGYEQKFLSAYAAVTHGAGHVLKPSVPHYADLTREILAVEAEAIARTVSYQLMIKAHLLTLSALLTRTFGIRDDSPLLEGGMKSRKFSSLREYLEEHYGEKLLVADLAEQVHMSLTNFNRSFKAVFGKTPMEYLMQTRIRHAARILIATERKIIDVAIDCGFPSISHFVSSFRRITGVAPHLYRKQQHLQDL